jgi:hypothetical protein
MSNHTKIMDKIKKSLALSASSNETYRNRQHLNFLEINMKSFEQIAASMYHAYCKQAGGKTFDGKPLPTWSEIGAERQSCWVAAAKQAASELALVH